MLGVLDLFDVYIKLDALSSRGFWIEKVFLQISGRVLNFWDFLGFRFSMLV